MHAGVCECCKQLFPRCAAHARFQRLEEIAALLSLLRATVESEYGFGDQQLRIERRQWLRAVECTQKRREPRGNCDSCVETLLCQLVDLPAVGARALL
jgi:hypothetical protein